MFLVTLGALTCAKKKPGLTPQNTMNCPGKALLVALIADIVITIAALVVGILAARNVIPDVSSMTSNVLLGLGCSILGLWIISSLISQGRLPILACSILFPVPV